MIQVPNLVFQCGSANSAFAGSCPTGYHTDVFYMKKRRSKRRWSIHPINRETYFRGQYETLFKNIQANSHDEFVQYTRTEAWQFSQLFELVRPYLLKRSLRKPIPPEQRLAMTLRFLAHGESMKAIAWDFRCGKSTVSGILRETCNAIWLALKEKYVCIPNREEWQDIAQDYWDLWNFTHCVGAIDGKHIRMKAPPGSGSEYFNYKSFHSIVLMASCDARYRFTWVDVGAFGMCHPKYFRKLCYITNSADVGVRRIFLPQLAFLPSERELLCIYLFSGAQHDRSVFNQSSFRKSVLRGTLNLPEECPLTSNDDVDDCTPPTVAPFWFVTDKAFPLSKHIMCPYPGMHLSDRRHLFNYRLSRARRTIENTFGNLAARWQVFQTTLQSSPATVERYVLACVCLHNFLMKSTDFRSYYPPTLVDREIGGTVVPGDWRNDVGAPAHFRPMGLGANYSAQEVVQMRNRLAEFFETDAGFVDWQYDQIYRGINLP